MHKVWSRLRTLGLIVVASGAASAVQTAQSEGPCVQIAAACQQAGFARGATMGSRLERDCVQPVMLGAARQSGAGKPLPQIDPSIVAACKARNPNFGQRNAALPDTSTQPPVNPPSPAATTPNAPAAPTAKKLPNIVFILTDDLAWNLVQYMPHVLKMQKEGATFANYFVTDSLCCPSRSSIFTGRYPHSTGVYRNVGPDGGYAAFHGRGHEQATFATALSAAGYRTAMLGKYLNGYLPETHGVSPGWKSWVVGGHAYAEFNYSLNQEGNVVRYGNRPADYLTDVLSGVAVRFIKQAGGTPFFIEIATFAPHAPYTPAPRDANALAEVRAPRTPAFNAAPDANAPKWLRGFRPLSDADMVRIDGNFRKRAQSVLAVDAMIAELQAAVAAIGEANNTYFIFSSDNGYHMGEHRLMPGKMTAYDTDIHVPLIVTGPGVPAGITVDEIAANIDLCPTFTELGGMVTSGKIDGRSLAPLLRGQKVPDWRTVTLVEHRGPLRNVVDPDFPGMRGGNPTTYEAIRAAKWLYVEYEGGEREYHDLATDPHELTNSYSSLSSEQKNQLHATLDAVQNCHDAQSCRAAERPGGNPAQK